MDLDELLRQGKLKRAFRAKQKVVYPEFVSHITQRAAGREPLFVEESDYLYMLAAMKHTAEARSLDIYAFCLMPNHIHILLSPREDLLHEAMRDLFSRYAMMFNSKYERKGHLFGGPYRQAVCLDDAYLLAASLYIHMNPVRSRMVDTPGAYRWSSVNLFENPDAPRSFVKPGFVLSLLGSKVREQKRVYARLLKKAVNIEQEDLLERPNAVSRFGKSLTKAFPSVFSGIRKKGRIAGRTGLHLLDEAELDRLISQVKAAKGKLPPETREARRFLIEQLIARGYTRDRIASMLGVSVRTIYNAMRIAA